MSGSKKSADGLPPAIASMPKGIKKRQGKRRKSKSKDLVVELPKESLETVGQTPAIPKPQEIDVESVQRDIIFEPNPGPQTSFLAATEQEVLYGGAAGGGKSYSLIADPVRYLNNPNARMLIVRRSTEELRELISVSKTPDLSWSAQ